MNVHKLTEYMASMMNVYIFKLFFFFFINKKVRDVIILNYGKPLQIVSIVCLFVQ